VISLSSPRLSRGLETARMDGGVPERGRRHHRFLLRSDALLHGKHPAFPGLRLARSRGRLSCIPARLLRTLHMEGRSASHAYDKAPATSRGPNSQLRPQLIRRCRGNTGSRCGSRIRIRHWVRSPGEPERHCVSGLPSIDQPTVSIRETAYLAASTVEETLYDALRSATVWLGRLRMPSVCLRILPAMFAAAVSGGHAIGKIRQETLAKCLKVSRARLAGS
jgi:hypothetical protein